MMLSFGVFCFDLVVNKNCSLVIMEKTWISWTRPKSFFECFISSWATTHPHADQLQRKSVLCVFSFWI